MPPGNANPAHGNNSLVADRVALKLGEYVVSDYLRSRKRR